jgi:hypothetical protein
MLASLDQHRCSPDFRRPRAGAEHRLAARRLLRPHGDRPSALEITDYAAVAQIATTMNTYGHVLPATMQDAAERMDAIFAR